MTERNSQVEEVFSDAWQQVLAGRSIESVLADYPDYAAQLEPMLRLTKRVRAVSRSTPTLSPDALSRIQQRTRSALRGKGPYQAIVAPGGPNEPPERLRAPAGDTRAGDTRAALRHRPWFAPIFSTVQVSTGVLLLLVMVTAVALIFATMKLQLQAGTGTPPDAVAYSGTITKIEGAVWQVDESQVLIDDATEIHGQPIVGATMRCIAEPLGADKMKAFEIWVRQAPGRPTVTPMGPNGYAQHAHDGDVTQAP